MPTSLTMTVVIFRMLKKEGVTLIILLIAALASGGTIIILIYTESQIKTVSENIIERQTNEVNVLASKTTLRLSDAVTILAITGNLPQVTSAPNPSLIRENNHGVPSNVESGKRFVAKAIMQQYPNFETVSFLLPNGDVYFVEPFASQKNITLKNFAFRDYYKGVVASDKPYLSQIIRSNATGHLISALAFPIHAIDGSLVGIWIGALDLKDINKTVRELSSAQELVVYADQQGHKVASTNEQSFMDLFHNSEYVYTNITAIKNGMANRSGYTIEPINGVKTFVSYAPIHAISTNWVALSFQPYDKMFLLPNSLRSNALVMCIILVAGAAVVALLIRRTFRIVDKHAQEILLKDQQLQKYYDELITVNMAKEEFMSMINHELKTPLVPIKGYSDMLLRPKLIGELNDKQQKAVKSISYNVGKMELLVSDILDVYKLDLGKLKLSKTEADVTKLIEANVFEFKRLADEKKIVVESHIQYHGKVYCDERRIDQVITNLIKNAIDFVPANTGKITLGVENDENSIIFSVQDNGSGIPQDKIDKLFQKFYQIDTTMTRKHGGTGLGLTICKGIVEAHGGNIWVDRTYTIGSRFIFTLPLKGDNT